MLCVTSAGGLSSHPSHNLHMGFPIGSQSPSRILYLADGDAYTRGAFGGFQGEQCPIAGAKFCDCSANSSPAPTGAQTSGDGVTGDHEMDDACDEDDGEEPTWEDVLPTRGRETRREGGESAVADRLARPPLSAINHIVINYVPYNAVPQAAAPRRDRGGRQLRSLQRKIEVALSL